VAFPVPYRVIIFHFKFKTRIQLCRKTNKIPSYLNKILFQTLPSLVDLILFNLGYKQDIVPMGK
jgi:hypothetical protein